MATASVSLLDLLEGQEDKKKSKTSSEKALANLLKKFANDMEKQRKIKEKFDNAQLLKEKKSASEIREEKLKVAKEELKLATSAGEKFKGSAKVMAMEMKNALVDGAKNAAKNLAKNISSALNSSVGESVGIYTRYMAQVDARIQGAYNNMSFKSLSSTLASAASGNPYLKFTDIIDKLSELVGAGTTENLTERAFLATISGKIATTFDALDKDLLRIIRIQNMDTTASRLGMEASLTRLFNYYFGDTSYLSDSYDEVTAALIDLTTSVDANTAVETEFMSQKWLGALGSQGVSTSTLTSIATALNALGTGDIETLTSNEAMRNLLVMAINRTGGDFGSMLQSGISPKDTNTLLYGVVDYLREISSTENNVVRAQYAKLFGLTIADMNAISNMTDEAINDLYKSAMSYGDTLTELNYQLGQVGDRTHLSEKIDNVLTNVLAATGMKIAGSAALYGTYKAADLLENLTGGIPIPTIGVLGNFLDLNATVEGLVKTGVVGTGTLSSLMSALGNWAGGDMLSLSNWSSSYTKGSTPTYTSINSLSTRKSSTAIVSSTSESGMQQSMYDEQKQSAEEISGTKMEEESESILILRFIKEYLATGGSNGTPLKVDINSMPTYLNYMNKIPDIGL